MFTIVWSIKGPNELVLWNIYCLRDEICMHGGKFDVTYAVCTEFFLANAEDGAWRWFDIIRRQERMIIRYWTCIYSIYVMYVSERRATSNEAYSLRFCIAKSLLFEPGLFYSWKLSRCNKSCMVTCSVFTRCVESIVLKNCCQQRWCWTHILEIKVKSDAWIAPIYACIVISD